MIIVSSKEKADKAEKDGSGENNEPQVVKKKKQTGIQSTLYEARVGSKCIYDPISVATFKFNIQKESKATPAGIIMTAEPKFGFVQSRFGKVPLGSPLSFQFPLVEQWFKVHSSIQGNARSSCILFDTPTCSYPQFPNFEIDYDTSKFLKNVVDPSQLKLLLSLKLSLDDSVQLEKETRAQSSCSKWKEVRRNRFTASKFSKLYGKGHKLKGEKALKSAAEDIANPKQNIESNLVIKKKLKHGQYYEPVALAKYENYCKSIGHFITVESCGIVVPPNIYYMGASPDGKVTDFGDSDTPYGIAEVKCPEEYKSYDPVDAIYMAKEFCIVLDGENVPRINKEHYYFDQIQFQMGCTGAPWCDFIVYTLKGMVIDRVCFDKEHFQKICDIAQSFYFKHILPLLTRAEENSSS